MISSMFNASIQVLMRFSAIYHRVLLHACLKNDQMELEMRSRANTLVLHHRVYTPEAVRH